MNFIGSEVRIRGSEIPTAHIVIAVEAVSWSSPDFLLAYPTSFPGSTSAKVECTKSQLKAGLLLGLDRTTAVARI